MTSFDRFEQHLPELMADLAAARVPDYFDDLLQTTARQRQRPAWSSLERWLPVGVTTLAPVSNRTRSFAGLAILALVGLLIAAGVVAYVGSHTQRLPAPFGPAGNGLIYYSDAPGDIYAMDPTASVPRAIVSGPETDKDPLPSRDGQRIAFTRTVSSGDQLVIANADGSQLRPLPGTYSEFAEFDWSPDGTRIAIISTVDGVPSISIAPIDGSGTKVLPLGLEAHELWWLPDGRLVFHGSKDQPSGPTYGLYVVAADGSGVESIVPPSSTDDWIGISPSPDGRNLVYHVWRDPDEHGRLYVVDIASGQSRPVRIDGASPEEEQETATFSPDGTQILFNRYAPGSGDARVTVVPVAGGKAISIGPAVPFDKSPGAYFSPDGTSIIAWYESLNEVLLLDPAGQRPDQRLSVPFTGVPGWQRVGR